MELKLGLIWGWADLQKVKAFPENSEFLHGLDVGLDSEKTGYPWFFEVFGFYQGVNRLECAKIKKMKS